MTRVQPNCRDHNPDRTLCWRTDNQNHFLRATQGASKGGNRPREKLGGRVRRGNDNRARRACKHGSQH